MLCDRLRDAKWQPVEWLNAQAPAHDADVEAMFKYAEAMKGATDDELRAEKERLQVAVERLREAAEQEVAYSDLLDSCDGKRAFRITEGSIPEEGYAPFKSRLSAAQKFRLSADFADATLAKLATPDTIAKAAEWFRLTHDPMWLEWQHGDDKFPGWTLGALLTAPEAGGGGVRVHTASVIRGQASIREGRFYPETLEVVGDEPSMRVEGFMDELPSMALLLTDFVIRINSPRITEVRDGEDVTAINRKRARQGKQPLFSYRVVDLNAQVKAGLRAIEAAEMQEATHGRRRLHWKRGHFKACKNGIFWWNPHLAGRGVGVIDKVYAA